jgi:beta-glucanase (GH16 family)
MTQTAPYEFYTRSSQGGSVMRNLGDGAASDGFVAKLTLPGNAALGSGDHVSPSFASELGTNASFSYGTYRMRVKLGSCAASEEAVNGLFTYFNDGNDHDGDGITDNSEIDIEILCGTPNVAFLTVWTDYDEASGNFRKLTRAIDFATGDLWDSPNDHEYGLDRTGNDPAFHQPTFLAPDHFVDLGFEWKADGVRYFATIGGVEKTLWDLHDAAHTPHLPGAILFNIWHPGEHWFGGGGAPDYPAHDATLTIDWIKYWAP